MTSIDSFLCCKSPQSIITLLIISIPCMLRVLPRTPSKCFFLIRVNLVFGTGKPFFLWKGGNRVYFFNHLGSLNAFVFTFDEHVRVCSAYRKLLVCEGRAHNLPDWWWMSLGHSCVLAQQRRMVCRFYYIHVVVNDTYFVWVYFIFNWQIKLLYL